MRFSLAAESILRCLAAARWLRAVNCYGAILLLLLVFMTHISPPIKLFHIFTDL